MSSAMDWFAAIEAHLAAGTGAICIRTREEYRLLVGLLTHFANRDKNREVDICTCTMPAGACIRYKLQKGVVINEQTPVVEAKTNPPAPTFAKALEWAGDYPRRIVIFKDGHHLLNNPLHYRLVCDSLTGRGLRMPKNAKEDDGGSLAVFVGPNWELNANNPLRGAMPILDLPVPDREMLRGVASRLRDLPDGEPGERVVDALCGLSADVAEQAAAECLASKDCWDLDYIRLAGRNALKDAGLEVWDNTPDLGGLSPLKMFIEEEIVPWVRHPLLSVGSIVCAGLPGVGKSYWGKYLAHRLQCEIVRFSLSRMMHGIVGSSEANMRAALAAIDIKSATAPLVVIVDEIDMLFNRDGGNDGGTSARMSAEFLTWMAERKSKAIVIATLNHLDKLDAALQRRFVSGWFFDLPSAEERKQVAMIHFRRYGFNECGKQAETLATKTEDFSNAEIAQSLIPIILRRTNCSPSCEDVEKIIGREGDTDRAVTPVSKTQTEQLRRMRDAASILRRANSSGTESAGGGRRVRGAGRG